MNTLLASLLLTAVFATDAKDPDSAIAIGDRRDLLVDELFMEKSSGEGRLQIHQPEPREIMLRTDAPWEGNGGRSQP